jgi:hypothetical protein
MALAKPERWYVATRDPEGAVPVELPRRSLAVPALIVTGMFAVLAVVEAMVIRGLHFDTRSIADLAMSLFMLAWIAGWSVGVLILAALAALLWLPSLYREALYVRDGRLVSATRLGPLRLLAQYDLARIRSLRIEDAGAGVRVTFDYGEGRRSFGGSDLPRATAESIVAAIRAAAPTAVAAQPAAPALATKPSSEEDSIGRPSAAGALALIAANLVPLAGVLLDGWNLGDVMVLFWAESAIVAFYTLAKMALVGRWLAIPAGIFFLAHFGAFMAIHFLLIYEIFVRGVAAAGREPAAYEALAQVFAPLWPALAALFLSHAVSFALNFLGRGERRGATLKALMAAPYQRVVLMQVTLIFGGFAALALHDARPALALLVALKIAADLYAHRRERRALPRLSGAGTRG